MSCRSVSPSTRAIRFKPKRLTFATDWHGHLNFAFWLMELLRPRSVVELGVFRGDSLAAISQAAAELELDSQIFGVDTWSGDLTTGIYPEEVFDEVKDYFLFNHPSVVLCRKPFDDARRDFATESIDILHIDGLHTYEAVKNDFETWQATVSRTGVVLFHDICALNENFGTRRFWDEVKSSYPHFSFLHSNGLGVLLCGENVPSELSHLAICADCQDYARSIFESIGLVTLYNDKYRWAMKENEDLKSSIISLRAEASAELHATSAGNSRRRFRSKG